MNNQYLRLMQEPAMMDALKNSSVSMEDAALRSREYAKMFSRNEELRSVFGLAQNGQNLLQKTFSGYAETPLLSNQYFNASVASFVSSFAGFMSIERDFEQPNGLFYWFDVLGVTDLRKVIPNLGADNFADIDAMGVIRGNVSPSSAEVTYEAQTLKKLVPGTLRVKLMSGNSRVELVDNGRGEFMAVAGVLASNTTSKINYHGGNFSFTLANAPQDGDTIEWIAREDVTGTPCLQEKDANGNALPQPNHANINNKRFLTKMEQIALTTVPDMLVAEYNIAALGAMKKATGADMATFLFTKLRELYTKMINSKLITTLENGYQGNTMEDLDLSQTGLGAAGHNFMDYRSRVDLFDAYLINVESALAVKAVKGVTTTAYIAGANAANQFQKGGVIGKWEKNTKMTYINDLLGWYNGIPVLRSTDVIENAGEGTFYAIHKTADGQMAPLARGIYMPLTDTPTIGNYNNPTQMAAGIYYQEGTRYMAQELVQKVTFKMGL